MKIIVDADACPRTVKRIIIEVAKKMALPVLMVKDTSHEIDDGYSEVVTVDKADDSADFAIIGAASLGDIVVTQDYGLASILLAKSVYVIHQNGFCYTEDNIDRMLFERHIAKKARNAGKRAGKIRARQAEADESFKSGFYELCLTALRANGQEDK